jgi:hypothetical protein
VSILGVAASSGALAFATLDSLDWLMAGAAWLLASAYLIGVHLVNIDRGIKKGLAALVYTFGVGVFLWPSVNDPSALGLWLVAFSALAGANLALISTLEGSAEPDARRRVRLACLSAGAVLLALGVSGLSAPASTLAFSLALSSLLLAGLSLSSRTAADVVHALADLALLFPLGSCL